MTFEQFGKLILLLRANFYRIYLQVNWSVPSIRSVFQQNKDVKPASIDTVYAKLPSSASAAGNQPAANNENLHKVTSSQSVFGH